MIIPCQKLFNKILKETGEQIPQTQSLVPEKNMNQFKTSMTRTNFGIPSIGKINQNNETTQENKSINSSKIKKAFK